MQAALHSRHMGQVVRAYRRHTYHGHRGISQEDMANWASTSQAYISRIENGPEPRDLNRLFFWARLLGIPQRHLWFQLPERALDETTGQASPSDDRQAGAPAKPALNHGDRRLGSRAGQHDVPLTDLIADLKADLKQELRDELRASVEHLARRRLPPDRKSDLADGPPAPDHDEPTGDAKALPRELTQMRRVRDTYRGRADAVDRPSAHDHNAGGGGARSRRDPTVDPAPTLPNPPIRIDIETAQPARMGDYLLGGGANFSVDRSVIEYITEALPGGMDTARATVRASQAFQDQAVHYLAGGAGIRQFLHIGTRLPTGTKVHKAAQEIAPESRVVYVIDDDVTLAHAHQLLDSRPEGMVVYVRGDPYHPEKVIDRAADTLNFSLPVAVALYGALHLLHDEAAYQAVNSLLAEVVPGSYLVLTHLTADALGGQVTDALQRHRELAKQAKTPPLFLRTQTQITRFFDGLELIPPGVTPVDEWRPHEPPSATAPSKTFIYGGIGRKP